MTLFLGGGLRLLREICTQSLGNLYWLNLQPRRYREDVIDRYDIPLRLIAQRTFIKIIILINQALLLLLKCYIRCLELMISYMIPWLKRLAIIKALPCVFDTLISSSLIKDHLNLVKLYTEHVILGLHHCSIPLSCRRLLVILVIFPGASILTVNVVIIFFVCTVDNNFGDDSEGAGLGSLSGSIII